LAIANSLVIRRQLEGILNYREKALEKIFFRVGEEAFG
jgi:hypothetical protein